ncbi:uncharacterized protein LOC110710507 [Chenopodium quinoa]|uniref:uncharacterized protein LOC110710507 n=1 Tax=Chenopodium quinoa TaxID=63459 RepID=UPI000B781A7B|nr:uncharacterized protein LOC110710507 [Chenopodium quinoa]
MAGSERPVLKDMQNPSSQSSLHLKVDESPQSSVSEERKITSEPYQCNGSRQRESKKEESKQKWSRTFYSKVEDKKPQDLIILQASFPVVDEKLIEERRRAPPTFLFGHLLYDEAFDICNTSPMIFL